MRSLIHKLKRGILRLGALAHRTETTDGLVLLLVFAAAWWMAAQQGGARAEALPVAARLMLAALTIHGASLLIHRGSGLRLSLTGFLFLPFIVWLAIDALALAPDRGQAINGWILAAMLATGWHLTLHHARRTWAFLASLALLAGPAAILACGAFDHDDRHIRGLLGVLPNPAYAGHFISAMGTPGACAAVMLLALMPALALALNPTLRAWKRVTAAYFSALLLLGLAATDHAWAWLGFALGLAVMLRSLCQSNKVRLSIVGLVALAGWVLAPRALLRVGILRVLPGEADATPWLARAAGKAVADHPMLGGGAGSFPLSFEAARPATWQTDPASCGSLPVQILCEHGLLGACLVLAPVAWIAWLTLRRAVASETLSENAVNAAGGHRRVALRRSLGIGFATGAAAASLVLAIDHPGALPGVLLLLASTGAIAFRLNQAEESHVVPERAVAPLAFACLIGPALTAGMVLAPLESAALAAGAKETVTEASPAGMGTPALLGPEAQARLTEAALDLEQACRLNRLDGETHAWRAQSLALLMRQSPRDEALQGRARLVAAKAVALNPRSAWAHVVLGSILLGAHEAERRAEGLSHIRIAAELAPMNQSVALRLAQALGQTGAKTDELRAAYERAQLTNPNRTEIRDKLTLLNAADPNGSPSR